MENIEPFSSVEDIFNNEQEGVSGGSLNNVSCRAYYRYKLQMRDCDRSILLYARRLLHKYIVDMYIKVECTRLDFFRKKQNQIRADLYQGIVDSVVSGEVDPTKVGKRIVLPASFVGGPRDMKRRYLDAIALVSKFGKPDLFLTMTCNPEWPEIKKHLKYGQTAQDRPELAARVFRGKIHDLKNELFTKNLFGTVAAHVHVIEFQKRGLPHCQLLIILNKSCKITNAADFDRFVSAEIPDPEKYPDLYNKVIKHMMHGPCGVLSPKNVCMVDKQCKNRYPRPFCPETMQGKDSYPIYRRRDDGRKVVVRGRKLDNRWVVLYNPYLLSRYDCHINVEICSGIRAVKYLYKYIYKGHDKVVINITEGQEEWKIDEINQFQDARWVSAHEAAWRLFGFNLNEISPAVINLQLHFPNQQTVTYFENQNLESVLQSDRTGKTTLTEFFTYCRDDPNKEPHLYGDFPENFTWNKKDKVWSPREHKTVIGRISTTTPSDKERYYLRLLLSHVRSLTSYDDLLYFNGRRSETFKEAAEARGLLQSDNWLFECFSDAVAFQMPTALRRLFATILVFCEASDVKGLWDHYYNDLSEDFARQSGSTPNSRLRQTLKSIDYFLDSMGKNVTDFPLPAIEEGMDIVINSEKREVIDELSVTILEFDKTAANSLNTKQKEAYDIILQHVTENKPQVFFIDGPGGTGKTFLYRALLATIRSTGNIALATATSGVAASILPGGRTAHSRFKIPIDGDEAGVCNITKQSGTADLIWKASLIIWDEAPMAKRWDIEAVDRTFRDIMENDVMFGGKVIVLGGDFRQVLPVIPRATRGEAVNASLVKSYLWADMYKLQLTKNMRAQDDLGFSEFLLRVGDGREPTIADGLIQIPELMVIKGDEKETPEESIIESIYKNLNDQGSCSQYITERPILATKNETVDILNQKLIT